jgi:hypothetical protein
VLSITLNEQTIAKSLTDADYSSNVGMHAVIFQIAPCGWA